MGGLLPSGITIELGSKLGNFTIIFRAVQAPQVEESMRAINIPFIMPFLKPCMYKTVIATGTVRKILSSLIQVAKIKANPIVIILIFLIDNDKIISASK